MLKKSTILTLLILSLFVCGLQMAGPVAAVKVIDHGSSSYYDNTTNTTYKTSWKTYQYSKNYIYIKSKTSAKGKTYQTDTITIKKISSKKIKVIGISQGSEITNDSKTYFYYKATKYTRYSGTAKQYYLENLKNQLSFYI